MGKICKTCGKEYNTKNKNSNYCSKSCASKNRNRKFFEVKCSFCGNLFKPKKISTRCCSKSCSTSSRYNKNINEFNDKKNTIGIEKNDSKIIICPITNKNIVINGKRGNILSNYLNVNNIDHIEYFEKYFEEYIVRCKYCSEIISLKYNIHISENESLFCCKEHYGKYMSDHPDEYHTDESKLKQSNTVKDKIYNGLFTPCITNSWENSRVRIKVDGCEYKFRSTWESLFWCLNRKLKYEKIRIKYYDTKKQTFRNYIVDFVDEDNNILYEIKPKCNVNTTNSRDKEIGALSFCNSNNFYYKYITELYLLDNLHLLLKDDIVINNEKLYKSVMKLKNLKGNN